MDDLIRLRGNLSAVEGRLLFTRDNAPQAALKSALLDGIGALRKHVDASLEQLSVAEPHAANRRILVVDDQPSMLLMLRQIFDGNGFEVFAADTFKGALEKLSADTYDAIVTDVHLPDGNGLEILRRARTFQSASGGKLPVVVISGDTDQTVIAELERLEAAWVPKSKISPELVDLIVEQIDRFEKAAGADIVTEDSLSRLQLFGSVEKQRSLVDASFNDAIGCLRRMKIAREARLPLEWVKEGKALHGIVEVLGSTKFTPMLRPVLKEKDESKLSQAIEDERLQTSMVEELAKLHSFWRTVYGDLQAATV